jgi:hypothetical protein
MHRFNIFSQLHKGLKALLNDTATLLQQTDLTDVTEASFIIQRLEETVHLFKYHSEQENRSITSLVFEYEPAIWDAFQKEQQKETLMIQNLEGAIHYFRFISSPVENAFACKRLLQCFSEFIDFSKEHMILQEHFLNDILCRYYSDAVLFAAQQKLLLQLSERDYAIYKKWDQYSPINDAMI